MFGKSKLIVIIEKIEDKSEELYKVRGFIPITNEITNLWRLRDVLKLLGRVYDKKDNGSRVVAEYIAEKLNYHKLCEAYTINDNIFVYIFTK